MEEVVIRRSPWKMWGIALLGMPLGLLALDVLTQRRVTNALRDIVFNPQDTQLFEARDVIWAWLMAIVGLGMALFGLKELIFPTTVVTADRDGLGLKVAGPLRRPVAIPWSAVDDIGSASVEDDGAVLSVMWVRVMEPELLPLEPWGGRWMDERTIALLATDWDRDAVTAAGQITDVALRVNTAASEGDITALETE